MPRTKPVYATLKDADIPQEVLDRRKQVHKKLAAAHAAIALGQVPASETKDRREMHKAREVRKSLVESGPLDRHAMWASVDTRERIIHNNEILPLDFFHRGQVAARSVGCILKMFNRCATGFLVAPHILMTNNHVLPGENVAAVSTVEFEVPHPNGRQAEIRAVRLDPGRFWFTDERLDVTLVGLPDTPEDIEATADLGWHPMIAEQGKLLIGDPVNVIQHPGGRSKSVVVHNSNLLHLEHEKTHADLLPYAWYNSDTEPGSSGSPVFNRHWEVIALHHRSVPLTNDDLELLDREGDRILKSDFEKNPGLAVWIANEGSRTSQIVAKLKEALKEEKEKAFTNPRHIRVCEELLALWEDSRNLNHGQAPVRATATSPAFTESASARRGAASAAPTLTRAGGVTIQISIQPEAG